MRDAIGTPPYPLQLLGQTQNAVVPMVITFLLLRYTDLGRRRAEARADELLLPASIAARLRRGETRIAEAYPNTTVLFADIVEFTRWTAHTEPMRAVALLDELFTAFDHAAASFGLEKEPTVVS